MNDAQAFNNYWNRFLPAYDENSVPDSTPYPYITYSFARDEFDKPLNVDVSIWYRSPTWVDVEGKALEIYYSIGYGGTLVPYDNGNLWFRRGTPFSQRMGDPDDSMIRRIVLSIDLEYLGS